MIHLTADSHILLATQPIDFRCGIDGLGAVCRGRLAKDPRSGTLYQQGERV
ncbi:MAG: transposase [Alteromonadaceae bacterium]|jgi:transposase